MKHELVVGSALAVLRADHLEGRDLQVLADSIWRPSRRPEQGPNAEAKYLEPKLYIHITERTQPRPVWFLSRSRTSVTTYQSSGLALYAGISQTDYVRLFCLLAWTQLRTLQVNRTLEPEDLECQRNPSCLCSWQPTFEDYAYVVESRLVCAGCRRFYRSLGVESDLERIDAAIQSTALHYLPVRSEIALQRDVTWRRESPL